MKDHIRSDEEYLAAIHRSVEESRVPEGFDIESEVQSSIEKYWDGREKWLKEQLELELTTAKLGRRVAGRLREMETEGQYPAYSFGKYMKTLTETWERIKSYLQK